MLTITLHKRERGVTGEKREVGDREEGRRERQQRQGRDGRQERGCSILLSGTSSSLTVGGSLWLHSESQH